MSKKLPTLVEKYAAVLMSLPDLRSDGYHRNRVHRSAVEVLRRRGNAAEFAPQALTNILPALERRGYIRSDQSAFGPFYRLTESGRWLRDLLKGVWA